MASHFDTPDWHAAVGRLVSAAGSRELGDALADAVGNLVGHDGTCIISFHRQRSPDVLHHTLDAAGRRHYLDRYLAGPYLLDPLYQLALDAERPDVCRFRVKQPDRFRSSEYYRQYCDRTHLLDEMDYFVGVSPGTTVTLVVGRRTRRFSRSEIDRLTTITPLVAESLQTLWRMSETNTPASVTDEGVHRRLTECFDQFGRGVLTGREREISQLLLRGHSSKSIARELGIAPGTVMVHKRNLFSKLGITSQYQLFSLFIEGLGAAG